MTDSPTKEDLSNRLRQAVRAIENVLVAAHGIRQDLKPGHPPFRKNQGDLGPEENDRVSLAEALKHYGPGPLFNLWTILRALDELSRVWIGKDLDIPTEPTP